MLKLVFRVLSILSNDERLKLVKLQVLVFVASIFETIGIISIAPFMSMLTLPSIEEQSAAILYVYSWHGGTYDEFIIAYGAGVIILVLLGNTLSLYSLYLLTKFGQEVGQSVSKRLFRYYLSRDYSFFASNNTAVLTSVITQESVRFADYVLKPLMLLNSKIFIAILLSIVLFLVNPIVATVSSLVFTFIYVLIYVFFRVRLSGYGTDISNANAARFKVISESFGGIKDLIITGKFKHVINIFERHCDKYAKAQTMSNIISKSPKYILESVAFSMVILVCLVVIIFNMEARSNIIEILSIYTLGAYKLLPALQLIFGSVSVIKTNVDSLVLIERDLHGLPASCEEKRYTSEKFIIKNEIRLCGLEYRYSLLDSLILKGVTYKIEKNTFIGIVGKSGAGKSTLLNIILGFFSPTSGKIFIDDIVVNNKNMHKLRNVIGYVPQQIYLLEGTFAQNIAFGFEDADIDLEKVKRAAEQAQIYDFICTLESGFESNVGERGIRLSGGQIQRVGIARALFRDPQIMIFDEATSALDSITEAKLMDEIFHLSKNKTVIVVAHRINTLKCADKILVLENGLVEDSGSYLELLSKNPYFRELVNEKEMKV